MTVIRKCGSCGADLPRVLGVVTADPDGMLNVDALLTMIQFGHELTPPALAKLRAAGYDPDELIARRRHDFRSRPLAPDVEVPK